MQQCNQFSGAHKPCWLLQHTGMATLLHAKLTSGRTMSEQSPDAVAMKAATATITAGMQQSMPLPRLSCYTVQAAQF
jgi:hypothetical protein